MESQLQTAALIAAMAKKSLRDSLDVAEFDGAAQVVAKALKDGKSKDARDNVQRWLAKLGVVWDGKSDIGEAILRTLKETNAIRRAKAILGKHQSVLRWPNLSGPKQVAESLKFIQQLEEMQRAEIKVDAKENCRRTDRESDGNRAS